MRREDLDTRERILDAARQEFLEKGYKGAWLRDIAKKAGVTTGALYGYFKNKEELYGTLVSPAYQGIVDLYRELLTRFAAMPHAQQQASMAAYTADGMIRMADFVYENHDAFKLLLSCSEDTEYADLIEALARMDEQANRNFEQVSSQAGAPVSSLPPKLEHILTTGLFTMFFELILHDIPRDESEAYIRSMIRFFTCGYAGIMGF